MSTVNVSDEPQVSCDCDWSDTLEISAQMDLLTEGSLSKPRQNVSESYRQTLQNLFSTTLLQE